MFNQIKLSKEYSYAEITSALRKFYRIYSQSVSVIEIENSAWIIKDADPKVYEIHIFYDKANSRLGVLCQSDCEIPTNESELFESPITFKYNGTHTISNLHDLAKVQFDDYVFRESAHSRIEITKEDEARLTKLLHLNWMFDPKNTKLTIGQERHLSEITKHVGPVLYITNDQMLGITEDFSLYNAVTDLDTVGFSFPIEPTDKGTILKDKVYHPKEGEIRFISPAVFKIDVMKLLYSIMPFALDNDIGYWRESIHGTTCLLPMDYVDTIVSEFYKEEGQEGQVRCN